MKNEAMIQIFVPILLIILSTKTFTTSALTTFGKSNTQTQNRPVSPSPVGNARECKVESDCNAIQNTTCLKDAPHDGTTRCLCGDYSAPINGRCNNKGKAVSVPCNDDAECHEGAECIEKKTIESGKKCYCKDGYWQRNFKCNGAETTFRFNTVVLMIVALLIVKNVGYST